MSRAQQRERIVGLLTEAPERSNRQIADLARCAPTTVGTVRAELEAVGEIGQLNKTVGKDGKARPATVRAAASSPAVVVEPPKPKPGCPACGCDTQYRHFTGRWQCLQCYPPFRQRPEVYRDWPE